MKQSIFIIDAFADRPLEGNPAAVCPLEEWLPTETMQAIAGELNLSETVFFAPDADNYGIRWFTPTREVDHIGHATLAAGALVLSRLEPARKEVRFNSRSGHMTVSRCKEGYSIDMPALPPHPIKAESAITRALGVRPAAVYGAKHYLVVFEDAETVRQLRPDFSALSQLDLPGTIITAPAAAPYDFVSRFFAPANGVPEDSVSGVAHCCLTPYWSDRLRKRRLVGLQVSPRSGVIICEERSDRVILTGSVATFLEGTISVQPGSEDES